MVRSVPAALELYALLGFREAFRDEASPPRYAGVARDGVEVHLRDPNGNGLQICRERTPED